ncbi:MAG: nucleotidyltransferase family protein [Candidatus Helarchaeota archaeon]
MHLKAVILAGGRGTRLKPYTVVFPKPLVPIGDKPILEILIKQLVKFGIKDFIFATGHLAELIKAFFNDGSKFGVKIKYSKEDTPLGTVGPLSKLGDQLTETFIVMNGDVLTDLDFNALIKFHEKSKAIATIALHERTVKIDYGVIELDDAKKLINYSEKPSINYRVSMGIYVFEPKILKYIPEGEYYDLPDLILKLINSGEIVKGYKYDGYWLDIGRPDDYERAQEEFDTIFNKK